MSEDEGLYAGLRRGEEAEETEESRIAELARAYEKDLNAHRNLLSPVETKGDPVNHPLHYTRHPAGVEVIEITEHEGFCLGNAVKYLLRAGVKGGKDKYVEDLEKAKWYIDREIHRFRREGNMLGWRAGLSCDS